LKDQIGLFGLKIYHLATRFEKSGNPERNNATMDDSA
jgi:hypothetical protein